MPTTESRALALFRDLFRRSFGLRIEGSRADDLHRALRLTVRDTDVPNAMALYHLVEEPTRAGRRALEVLVSHVMVGETHFFRNRAQFDTLEKRVLPEIIRRNEGRRRIRAWSAGCSTGEEAYSLAALVDRTGLGRAGWEILVLGTDADRKALDRAERATYRPWSFREIDAEDGRSWLARRGEHHEVVGTVRELVTFRQLNLATAAFPSPATQTAEMDLILCRNVLMYFDAEACEIVAGRLYDALVPGGWLVLGPTEAGLPAFRRFDVEFGPGGLLYRKPTAPRAHHDRPSPVPPVAAAVPRTRLSVAGHGGTEEAMNACAIAKRLADEGRLAEARRSLEIALDHDPLLAQANHLAGLLFQEGGNLDAALRALRRSVYSDPSLPLPRFALGSLLARRGSRDRAAQVLSDVVRMLDGRKPEEPAQEDDGPTVGELLQTARSELALLVEGIKGA